MLKKITIAFLILLILGGPIMFLRPEKSYALACPFFAAPPVPKSVFVPVYDTENAAVNTQTALATNNNSIKECILDKIVKTLMRTLVHQLTTSIVDWINRGFEGGPTFVTDPAGFFADIVDEEFGRIIDGSALGFLCDPFKAQIQFGFLSQHARFSQPARCTITGIIAGFDDFRNGDFSQGGWDEWIIMTQNPENNLFGSYMVVQNSLNNRIASRTTLEDKILGWGNGFRSLTDPETGEIKTPGTLINDQLSKAVGNDLDYLNLSREFDDIILALANLLVTKVMTGGLGQ